MFGLKRKKVTDLPNEEWDFSRVEPEDAKTCLRYEFAREIQHPESYFSTFKMDAAAPCLFELLQDDAASKADASEEYKSRVEGTYIRVIDTPVVGEKELGLREMLAGMYFRHNDGTVRAYPADLSESSWLALDESWRYLLTERLEGYIVGISTFNCAQDKSSEEKFPGLRERLSGPGARQIFTLAIDWRENNSTLIENFEKWLEKSRPAGFSSKIDSSRQSAMDNLNALSALRIRSHLSVEDAIRHTKAVVGKPLYQERSSWERAHKRATHLFYRAFPEAGEPRSANKVSNRK